MEIDAETDVVAWPFLLFSSSFEAPGGSIFEVVLRLDSELHDQSRERVVGKMAKDVAMISEMEAHKISKDEACAIVYYTLDARKFGCKKEQSFYWRLNQLLIKRDANLLEEWKDFLYYFLQGLNKLPDFKGKVYRGINKRISKVSSQYKCNVEVVWIAFTSTSLSMRATQLFIGTDGTTIELDVMHAKLIKNFSLFPLEGEVLLLPNSIFKVLNVTSGLDKDTLTLQQLPTPEDVYILPKFLVNVVGLCYYAVCKDMNCQSSKENQLIVRGTGKFNVMKDKHNVYCPSCNTKMVVNQIFLRSCNVTSLRIYDVLGKVETIQKKVTTYLVIRTNYLSYLKLLITPLD